MSFYAYMPKMRAVTEQLAILSAEIPMDDEADVHYSRVLVAQGMKNLIDQIALFDACLTMETPFAQHFFDWLAGIHDDDTGAERIFEDLVIFFREKALRLPPDRVTTVEKELLRYFEENQPLEDPESMVRRWYWDHLPSLVLYDFSRARGLESLSGLEYLQAVTGISLDS